MTADRLYEMIQEILVNPSSTPYSCYLKTKLLIRFHLMEKVETITWRFK